MSSRKRVSAAEQGAAMRRQLEGQDQGQSGGRSRGDLYSGGGGDDGYIDDTRDGAVKYKKGQSKLPGTLDHDKVHSVAMTNTYKPKQQGEKMSRETSRRSSQTRHGSRREYDDYDRGAPSRRKSTQSKRYSQQPPKSSRPRTDKRSSRQYGDEMDPYYEEREPRNESRQTARRYDDRQFDSDRRRSMSRPTTAAAAINGRRAGGRESQRGYDRYGDDAYSDDPPPEEEVEEDYIPPRRNRSSRSRAPDRYEDDYDEDYGTSRRQSHRSGQNRTLRDGAAAAAGAGVAAGAVSSRRRGARDRDDYPEQARRTPQSTRRRAEPVYDDYNEEDVPDEDEEEVAAAQSPKSRRSHLPASKDKKVKPKKSKSRVNGGAASLQPFEDDDAVNPEEYNDGFYSESEVGPRNRSYSRQSAVTPSPAPAKDSGKEKKGLLGGLAAGGLVGGLLGSAKKKKNAEKTQEQEQTTNEKNEKSTPRRAIAEESEDEYNLDSESDVRSRAQSRRAAPQKTSRSAASNRERRSEVFNEKEPRASDKRSRRKKEAAAAAAGVGAGAVAGGRLKSYSKSKKSSRAPQEEEEVSPSEDELAMYSDDEAQDEPRTRRGRNATREPEPSQPQPSDGGGKGGLLSRLTGKKGGTAAAAGAGAGAAAAASVPRGRGGVKLDPKGRVYPLTGIDNLALLMEDDGYQTVCFSVYLFKTVLDYDTVLDFFERLADAYPKYRYVCELNPAAASGKDKKLRKGKTLDEKYSRFDPGRKTLFSRSLKAGGNLRPARWRIDENFKMEENIEELESQGSGSDADLFAVCDEVLSEHFNFNKPLWQAYLVHGLNTAEGARSALMIKIHHAFSDGQGMIQSYHSAAAAMQQGVSIESKQGEFDAGTAAKSESEKRRTRNGRSKGAEAKPEQKKIGSRNIKPTVFGTVRHTWHTVRGLYFRRRKAFTYPKSAGKAAVKANGGKLGRNGRPSGRLYAHSEGIPMEDIQLIRKAFSTDKVNLSLNDVNCAILSRALRLAAEDMAQYKGQRKVTDKRTAIFIPISKRPKGDWSLSNYTTGAIAWFRFHEPSQYGFEQLLLQVHREMNRIKQSYLPHLWFSIFKAVCKRRIMMVPNYPIGRSIFQRAYQEYSVCTCVPGPAEPISFGKHKAFSYHVLPPSSPGRGTMAIGTISYGKDFSVAVSCDAVKDFEENDLAGLVCDAWQDAAEEIVKVAKTKIRSI